MDPSAAEDDYLSEILELDSRGLPPTELARVLEQRADQSPPGSAARSAFLSSAGDRWGYAGDTVRAEAAYRASIANGGDPGRYADSALVLLLLQADRGTEADEVLASLRELARTDTLTTVTYEMVGEALEEAGRLREALRWLTIPLRRLDPDDLDADELPLLQARSQVRRALDLPPDGFDLAHERLRAQIP